MNAKEAKEIVEHGVSVVAPFAEMRSYQRAKGYLAALEGPEVKALVDMLTKFESGFKAFSDRQHKLLVEGQSLESASKNWDKFPEAFNFDLAPLWEALAAYKKAVEGKERKEGN